MDRFEEGWEYDAELDAWLEPEADPEELYLSLISDEERHRYWSESVWTHDIDDGIPADALLFADRGAEGELCREIRLSELWGLCQDRPCTMEEFLELSTLITEVGGIPGSLCVDCAMLEPPQRSDELGAGHDDPLPWAPPLSARSRADRRRQHPPLRVSGLGLPCRAQWGRDVGRPCLRRIPPERHVRPALGSHGRPLLRQVPFRVRPGAAGRHRRGPRAARPRRDRGTGGTRARWGAAGHHVVVGDGLARVLRPQAAEEVRHRADLRRR